MKQIALTKNQFALVDDDDFEILSQRKWYADKGGNTYYALKTIRVNGKKKNVSMHRILMGVTDPKVLIDHKDGNGLNNQRNNLRIANHSQNKANTVSRNNTTSKYLGVCWRPCRNRWQAQLKKDYKIVYLGMFKEEKDAALAYNIAAIKLHGEFANLNKLPT